MRSRTVAINVIALVIPVAVFAAVLASRQRAGLPGCSWRGRLQHLHGNFDDSILGTAKSCQRLVVMQPLTRKLRMRQWAAMLTAKSACSEPRG